MKCPYPTIKLNNGAEMPLLGLGTWKSKPGEVKQAVIDAIKAGYHHIDCAMAYDNECEVGEALKECIPSIVKREDLFITTKLWLTDFEHVEEAINCSLKRLGVDYIDLYLMHWPIYLKPKDLKRDPKDYKHWFPGFDCPVETHTYDEGWIVQTWKDMESLVEKGLTKAIGISNFSKSKIGKLLETAKIVPAMNQVEIHPALSQNELIEYCRSKGIQVTAYSPLGSMDREAAFVKDSNPVPLKDPVINEIAKKHNKTAAQVILKWSVQRKVVTIPKSVHKERIEENIKIFDFELSDEEMKKIADLNTNNRIFIGENFFSKAEDREKLWA